MDWGSKVTYIGATTLKERTVNFGIKDADRTKHFSILGRTGSGRGDMLVSMALQDIERGLGVVLLDATGVSATKLMERIGPEHQERLVFLDPSDGEYPYSWNLLDDIRALPEQERQKALSETIAHVFNVSPSPCVDVAASALLARTDTALLSFHSLVTDPAFREKFFEKDESGKKHFGKELACVPDLVAALEGEGKYIAKDTLVRNLIGQQTSKFTLGPLARGQIVIVDFSHIRIYPTRMSPLVRTFVDAARFAASTSASPVALYLHDAIRYLTEGEIDAAFAPQAKLAVTIADTVQQEADQDRRLYALSRVASVASFAAHAADRSLIERAFYPFAEAEELIKLDPREFIITLTIDGVRKKPFFATALPPHEKKNIAYQDIVVAARQSYTTPRSRIDIAFAGEGDGAGKGKKGPPGAGTPKGFQDAFKSIFAKQAERAKQQASSGDETKSPQAPAAGETGGKTAGGGGAPPPPASPAPEKREVPERALKQMLYVAPIPS